MLRSAFTTSVPEQIHDGNINWRGSNEASTLIYRSHNYYDDEKSKVKVHRVSVFGGPVQEIADIEFFTSEPLRSSFNGPSQRMVWYHSVDPKFAKSTVLTQNTVVILNVQSGQLKRYYANVEEKIVAYGNFMNASVDVLLLKVEENVEHTFSLYEIQLNHVDETFSLNFIVKLFHEEYSQWDTLIYYGHSLICHPRNANLDYLLCYEFKSGRWSRKDIFWECEKPETLDLRPFYGDCFLFVEIGRKIRLIKLDRNTLTWTDTFSITQMPRRSCYKFRDVKLLPNGLLHYALVGTTTAKLTKIRIEVHCQKNLPLKFLCLRALWLHVRQISYNLSRLSDHDLCERLMLSSVLNVEEYFGKKFN